MCPEAKMEIFSNTSFGGGNHVVMVMLTSVSQCLENVTIILSHNSIQFPVFQNMPCFFLSEIPNTDRVSEPASKAVVMLLLLRSRMACARLGKGRSLFVILLRDRLGPNHSLHLASFQTWPNQSSQSLGTLRNSLSDSIPL